jgi:hypothetical protein
MALTSPPSIVVGKICTMFPLTLIVAGLGDHSIFQIRVGHFDKPSFA